MSKPKPGLGKVEASVPFLTRLAQCVEVMMGRRGKTGPMVVTAQPTTAVSPTGPEFNKVVDDLRQHAARFNELLEQVQD